MSRLVRDRVRASRRLQELYAPIQAELETVEEALRREFSSQDPFVDRLARHGFRLGGKRLRPALVLLSAQACGGSILPAHVVLATVMEMIHTATLLHDDVLDEATIRRHTDTVNARWNNEASILLGDFLLARAIEHVASLDCPYACRVIAEASRVVCEGELRQVSCRGDFDLAEDQYLAIIADKTAALTSCSCRLGAYYAGADAALCERFARFGRWLGIAFQIADDLLDVLGDEATTGKSLGTDLAKQKATLPLIRLLDRVSTADRQEVLGILNRGDNHRMEALRAWYHSTDAIPYAHQKAAEYAQRAAGELEGLQSATAVKMLLSLTEFVVARHE